MTKVQYVYELTYSLVIIPGLSQGLVLYDS